MKKATVLGITFIISLIVMGYGISSLWQWFIVPLGVLPISAAHATGIALLVALLCKTTNAEVKTYQQAMSMMVNSIITWILAFAAGAVIATFFM